MIKIKKIRRAVTKSEMIKLEVKEIRKNRKEQSRKRGNKNDILVKLVK